MSLAQVNDKAQWPRWRTPPWCTPLHGTGYQRDPPFTVLGQLGVKHLHCVPEQMVIDGTFPTVKSPNPETPESFALAQKLAKEVDADLILGSDPDADRVAIQVKGKDGAYVQISGNQTGVLLLDYLIGAKKRAGTLPDRPVALKSLLTTDLARVVAEANGVESYNTFTGFKFMAEKKNQLEAAGQGHVIFSYEESIGYMIGDYVRDKDAVTASLLLTEMTAWYASQGMTLLDALEAIYQKYGYYGEETLNLVMPGLEDGQHEGHHGCLQQTPLADCRHLRPVRRTTRTAPPGTPPPEPSPRWNWWGPTSRPTTWPTAPPLWCALGHRSPRSRSTSPTKGDSHADCQRAGLVPDLGRGPGPVTGGAEAASPQRIRENDPDPAGSRVVFWERRWGNPGKRKEPWRYPTKRRSPFGRLAGFTGKAAGYLTKILKNGMVYPT